MMSKIKIGLLPLYVALYERVVPQRTPLIQDFYDKAVVELEARGFEVLRAPICHVADEFSSAIHSFEQDGAKCIVTLHLAYSPSLESIEALAATTLPLVILDTTLTYDFSPAQDPAEIGTCHGIHGVMDMCNLLKKHNKKYAIAAGHLYESPVVDRVADLVRAAVAAGSFDGMKVASVGGSFAGMGDFVISDEDIKARFGIEIVYPTPAELRAAAASITAEEIAAEMAADHAMGKVIKDFDADLHARSTIACLALRRWMEEQGIGAYTANFLKISESGLTAMPFMEACKAMARGMGYAGEGDVMTAAFCGALLKGFAQSSFIEIFCPDWKGGRVMLSHMGELNYACADAPIELTEMNFIYGTKEHPVDNPIVGYARLRAGKAVFANLYDDGNGYRLLLSPVEMVAPECEDQFVGKMRGWLKPASSLEAFLEGISRAGATHHSMLVYDTTVEALTYFGELIGAPVEVI